MQEVSSVLHTERPIWHLLLIETLSQSAQPPLDFSGDQDEF